MNGSADMTRKILAVLFGMITAFVLVAGIEALGHKAYPPPPGLDVTNAEQLAEYMQMVPLGALAWVLAAWTIATLVGGMVACSISKGNALIYASVIGALVMAATITNLMMIPHPRWFSITAIVLIVVATLIAAFLSDKRTF